MAEAGRRKAARGAGKRNQILVLAAALGLLIFACIAVIQLAPPGDVHAARLVNEAPLDDPTATNTPASGPPTATPTATHTFRRTPTPTSTAAQTVTPGATATSTPAATGGGGGGGGVPNDGGDNSGPQPTKVVLSQPTIGAVDNGPLGGLDTTSNGANGVWIASLFGCFSAILGILVAAIALSVLVRGGYGPFLRALALGSRANRNGKGTNVNGLPSQASGRLQATPTNNWEAPTRGYDYRDDDALPRRGVGRLCEDDARCDNGSSRARNARDDRPPPASPRTAPRTRGRGRADW